MTLLAGRVGQIVNFTGLSNDIGVSATTIRTWISALKAPFVVFELAPFFDNIKKRVIKAPKLYFCDPGLAAFLLGIETAAQVSRDPLRGGLYENLLIAEMLKYRYNNGLRPEMYFYRDSNGNEVDLILKEGRRLVAVEIKSAATFTSDFIKGIERFSKTLGDRQIEGVVFYNGPHTHKINRIRVLNPLLHGGIESAF